MTSKLTRDRLHEIAEDGFLKHGESKELARMALSAMNGEPFAYIIQDKYERERGVEGHLSRSHVSKYVSQEDINEHEITCIPLYRHAQPAPVELANIALPHSWLDGEGVEVMSANEVKRACRASMLQTEPVMTTNKFGNPPAIPDSARDALEKALAAMEFMGDTLNNLDAVCTEDVELVAPAFDAVRNVLAADQQEGKQ